MTAMIWWAFFGAAVGGFTVGMLLAAGTAALLDAAAPVPSPETQDDPLRDGLARWGHLHDRRRGA